jgi:hypothetical protein
MSSQPVDERPLAKRVRPGASAVIFAVCAVGSLAVAWLGLSTRGFLPLFLPLGGFAVAGLIAGLSLNQGKAVAAITTIGWFVGGVGCLLAVVSTQAWQSTALLVPGMTIAFSVVWLVIGFGEGLLVLLTPGRERASAVLLNLPLTLGFGGLVGGALAGVAMTLGASNDPIVVTLLGIAFVIPYASKGYAFALLPPPNAA